MIKKDVGHYCESCLTRVPDWRTINDDTGERDVCIDCLWEIKNNQDERIEILLQQIANQKVDLDLKQGEYDKLQAVILDTGGLSEDVISFIEGLSLSTKKKKREIN